MLTVVLLAIGIAAVSLSWLTIFRGLAHRFKEVRNGRLTAHAILASPSGAVLQVVAIAAVFIALANPHDSLGEIFLGVLLLPVFAPLVVISAWSKFYSFLAVPSLAALLISTVAAFTWRRLVPGWGGALWPTIAVVVFSATFLAGGQLQFHQDVKSAAAEYEPDCLDAGSFLAPILADHRTFNPISMPRPARVL